MTDEIQADTAEAPAEAPAEHTPSPDEARSMFDDNPGLSAVLTTEGFLHRDGTITEQ